MFYAGLLAPLAWLAWQLLRLGGLELLETPWQATPLTVYGTLAAGFGAFHLAVSIRQRLRRDLDDRRVTSREPRVVDLARVLGSPPLCGPRAKLLARVPGNQLCHLQLNESTLTMPGLAAELQGLSICHLSDLHFSGRLDRGYYREMVRLANDSPADLLALTGDICDLAACIAWVPELLGPLQARLGKYYILGNHDLRTHDVGRLRAAMREAGFVDLGGRAEVIADARIVVAGDERPWFAGEPSLDGESASDRPLKILLAHTPDRLRWARRQGYELVLAGHTHGGQICFPLAGPVVCPSWHGTRYASGFFYEAPTLMHVSRGSASLFPLRLACPPEIARLVLTGQR